MNKKSLSQKIIVGFIIVIVSAIVFLLIMKYIFGGVEDLTHKQKCKNAVAIFSATQWRQYQLRPYTIECPIVEKYLYGDPAKKRQADAMKRIIADLMADTWDVYGENKMNLFDTSGIYCAVYSVIEFDQKGKQLAGFNAFLTERLIPSKGITYMDYLTNEKVSASASVKDTPIDMSKKYAVVLVYSRDQSAIADFITRLGGGGQTGAFAGTIGVGVGGAGAAAIGIAFLGGGWVVATAGGIAAGGLAAYEAILGGKKPEWIMKVEFTPYDSPQALENLGCTKFPISLATRQ